MWKLHRYGNVTVMPHCDLTVPSCGMAHQQQIKALVLQICIHTYICTYLPRVRFLHMANGAVGEENTSSSCLCEDKTGETIDLSK